MAMTLLRVCSYTSATIGNQLEIDMYSTTRATNAIKVAFSRLLPSGAGLPHEKSKQQQQQQQQQQAKGELCRFSGWPTAGLCLTHTRLDKFVRKFEKTTNRSETARHAPVVPVE
jgi:hypothetical protein